MYPLAQLRRVITRSRWYSTCRPLCSEERADIVEGSIRIKQQGKLPAFYNNMQVVNRDLSVQVIASFSETILKERSERRGKKTRRAVSGDPSSDAPTSTGITVLDALAATGLRSMRYIDEIPNIVQVTANDISPQACEVMHEGIEYNSIDKSKISVTNGDAVFAMHKRRNDGLSYDVIDIDPYGSAVPFLDAAVQTVAGDGGLLCITCTDTSVLCGVFPETSLPRYGTVAFKAGYKHEMALRMLLHAVDSAANRYKRYIVPLVSVSLDFYVRVFVRVYESQVDVKRTLEKRLMLYQSTQCPTFHTQSMGKVWPTKRGVEGSTTSYQVTRLSVPPTCASGGQWKVGGPFWGAALHDQSFVESLLRNVEAARIAQSNDASVKASKTVVKPPARTVATAERLAGVLSSISEELKDVPFYYCLTDLSAALQCNTPTQVEFRSALINAGYKVSRFHSEPDAIKTNAPSDVVWDVMRAYCQQNHPRHFTSTQLRPVAQKILEAPATTAVSFKFAQGSSIATSGANRYPKNPERNWGPRRRTRRPPGDDSTQAVVE